jgi:hypothetical protein
MRTLALVVTSLLTAVALFTLDAPVLGQRSPSIASSRVDADVIALACAPLAATSTPKATLRISGGQDTYPRLTFSQGDFVTLNAGSNQGLRVGQEFFVRRLLAPRGIAISTRNPGTTQTAGWIRVYAVDEDMALATITHGCDGMQIGDYLEPLALPAPLRANAVEGKPERSYARVVLGNDRRTEFGQGDYLVIDRGSSQGITAGAHFVLYRWKKRAPENFLAAIAEGVAVDVQGDSATLSLTSSRDAVMVGDLAAMRK